MTTKTPSPVDKMNEYKGGNLPSPIIPLVGLGLGLGVPFGLVQGKIVSAPEGDGAVDAIVSTLQSFGYVG